MTDLNTDIIDASWRPIFDNALAEVDESYLRALTENGDWLPGANRLFNAFSLPLGDTRYILFGESPYPRADSANGYAFWDAAVHEIWSETGLSKAVNRATSLRNFVKMLLVAEGRLDDDMSQGAIAKLDKSAYIQSCDGLFDNLINRGFLLLNASLVLSTSAVAKDAKAWRPFMAAVIAGLHQYHPQVKLILFGKIAEAILDLPYAREFDALIAEHPYNLTFIHNPKVLDFFRPLHLLQPER